MDNKIMLYGQSLKYCPLCKGNVIIKIHEEHLQQHKKELLKLSRKVDKELSKYETPNKYKSLGNRLKQLRGTTSLKH